MIKQYKALLTEKLKEEKQNDLKALITNELNLRTARWMFEEKKDMNSNHMATKLKNDSDIIQKRIGLAEEMIESIEEDKFKFE